MTRARDLGIVIGDLSPGPLNTITDVADVAVGHRTIVEGDGPLVPGRGPIRTGVTVVVPLAGHPWEALFAGCHRLNGNGEMTGLEWLRESGLLSSPVAITNTHSVGVVRDAVIRQAVRDRPPGDFYWGLPVVGETWDGLLNDINGFHVLPEHLEQALAGAAGGPVAEGGVGGGTGMICHGFKGGIGTASRVLPEREGGFTVGVLVQANHGRRDRLRINSAPVGEVISTREVPEPEDPSERPPGAGSIIVVVATDAPLLPGQCDRLAQRAGLGIARTGGVGENSSGDIFICFSTANRGMSGSDSRRGVPLTAGVQALNNAHITPLFDAVVEATEESIVNALVAAETMVGRDGITAHGLDGGRLLEVLREYRATGPVTAA